MKLLLGRRIFVGTAKFVRYKREIVKTKFVFTVFVVMGLTVFTSGEPQQGPGFSKKNSEGETTKDFIHFSRIFGLKFL